MEYPAILVNIEHAIITREFQTQALWDTFEYALFGLSDFGCTNSQLVAAADSSLVVV